MAPADIDFPPLDGSINVLPGFIDYHAKHNPERPFFVFPYPDLASDELRTVSFLEFAQGTHRAAYAFRASREGPDGAVVAMIANVDTLLYHAMFVGLVRAGYVPFPMSPRNSAPAIANMMQRTQCHRIISQTAFTELMAGVRGELPSDYAMKVDEPPSLTSIFPSLDSSFQADVPLRLPPPEPYPPPPHEPSPTSIAFYLHSSGSTGHPKPIPQTHEFVRIWCTLPPTLGARFHGRQYGGHALPSFHTMGIAVQLLAPLASGLPGSLFPPREVQGAPPVVPTPQNTIDTARKTGCNTIVTVPAFLEAWAHNDEDIEYLATLKCLLFAGGPLSKVNGDKLVARGVRLYAGYGTTEVGTLSSFPDDGSVSRADWEWIALPDVVKQRWVDQGDGTYELQFLSCPTHRPAVENFQLPNGEHGYSTSDIWIPHPTEPGLWKIVARTDDVIVLGSGEKTVPIQLEGHVSAHPLVVGVVAFGRGHQQVGILVEAKAGSAPDPADEAAAAEFRNAIWPRVEQANHEAPAFSRVFKEMILVADPSRPLPRAGKGTVQRKKALELYAQDIEDLYQTVEESANAHEVAPPQSWEAQDVQKWLAQHAASIHAEKTADPDRDLFEQGFDSLSATFLRNRIIGALRASSDSAVNAAAQHVPQNFVFQHPTLASLAKAVSGLVRSDEFIVQSPSEEIEAMIKKYTAMLPAHAPEPNTVHDVERVVLLTGTTGNLGAHVLALLLKEERTKRVYALNRGSDLVHRQRAAFNGAQLPVELLDQQKLVLLSVDYTQDGLGLPQGIVNEVRQSVTHLVHSAWRVDFNLALTSFETQIAGAIRLLTMAPTAHYLFTSSVSVAGGWNVQAANHGAHVPETALHDPSVAAVTSGYGMSKYVVEEVLASGRQRGLKTTTLRIGQISGASQTGAWNASEWVPNIVKSSLALGALPNSGSAVSWVPMDAVARAVVDVVLGREAPELINVVHPRPAKWSDVFGAMQAELGVTLPFVPFDEWVKRLEAVADNASASDLEKIPGVKLLEYYRALVSAEAEAQRAGTDGCEAGGLPLFETSKACSVSKTLAGLPPLSAHDARAWVRYWKKIEFLP